ncbi:MAG TPA: class I poly(R)-hydroxyalkanoic acid synthase [Hyphomicrobiaceae bacterium]|nr:class I poly(R)-hydroxyalkanoic acid synthase [Hyphomicrobiaceae bacterium]
MQKPVDTTSQFLDTTQLLQQNPEKFAANMMKIMEESAKVAASIAGKSASQQTDPQALLNDASETAKVWTEIAQSWLKDPQKLAEMQSQLMTDYFKLWQQTADRMIGKDTPEVAKPDAGDGRFRDAEWSSNPYFAFWKQAYLLTSKWANESLEKTDGLDERSRMRAEFLMKQVLTAMSPSNYAATNPEVIRETLRTQGANLIAGLDNLSRDLAQSDTMLKISQVDTTAFEVGRNVATTPGKVVFQNDLLQLIQYSPTTPEVREIPFLIIPPWINKYYILDLTADKSFIKYVVDQGFTVFVVSWVNPDERLTHKTFEDYMKEGLLAATDAVKRECGVKRINILGYCIGGTLLATTLAYLAGRGEEHFNSATFLVAQKDFTKAGELKMFIDEAQLDYIKRLMAEKGYLEGSRMATVFNMLRPRDLIWPYIVNNYLMGKKPMAFDLLYWNQDSTRMPAANHNFYLREFYHENKLALGKLKIGGVTCDLGKVKLPVFELATREDHISPPRSVFTGAKMFGGPVEFVLAGSGHIAGVVSPPGKTKYPYWRNKRPLSHPDNTSLDNWIAGAEEIKDSWWPMWIEWLTQYSGDTIKARKPGAKLGVIEDAPGSYVKAKA